MDHMSSTTFFPPCPHYLKQHYLFQLMRANYPFPCGNSSPAGSEAKAAAITHFSLKRRYLGMLLSFGSPKNLTEMAEAWFIGCMRSGLSILPLIIRTNAHYCLHCSLDLLQNFFLLTATQKFPLHRVSLFFPNF